MGPRRQITNQSQEEALIKVHEAKRNTITYGFVATPDNIKGLMVSADYFNIKVDNYISPVDPSAIIKQCIDGAV